ncbi:MAG: hypothetical protein EP334_10025 [Gammaproteobacteria bacterium]|nr:MAG: hypothetical protein EP334_10025 [Gammaproteobacteria bacterium]
MDLREVEKEIARILQTYEVATGNVVKAISLESVEITSLQSDKRELHQRVLVDAERLPGNSWDT